MHERGPCSGGAGGSSGLVDFLQKGTESSSQMGFLPFLHEGASPFLHEGFDLSSHTGFFFLHEGSSLGGGLVDGGSVDGGSVDGGSVDGGSVTI